VVLERRAYKPFGEVLEVEKKAEAGFTTNRGFTGHEQIEEHRGQVMLMLYLHNV